MSDLTRLLEAIQQGDAQAANDLLPLVYDELRRLAAQKLAHESPGQTLQATALVHEVYLRLVGKRDEAKWQGPRHFFAAAAEAMRRILVENARRKKAAKHGGGLSRHDATELPLVAPLPDEQLIALDEALAAFTEKDPLKAELVKLRFFAGLTLSESARILDISDATADRYWAYARAWLFDALGPGAASIKHTG